MVGQRWHLDAKRVSAGVKARLSVQRALFERKTGEGRVLSAPGAEEIA